MFHRNYAKLLLAGDDRRENPTTFTGTEFGKCEMREINLPTTQTFSMPLDVTALRSGMVRDRYNQGRTLGSLVVNERVWSELATAKKNGGAILYATTSIEQKLESVLLNYFLGPSIRFNDQRRMFDREILKSTVLSFSAKKELVIKVINEGELLSKKNKPVIPKCLKEIMEWRNAFAHGKLIHDSKSGCVLEYYTGHSKKLHLTDEYWDEVETCFKKCNDFLDEVERQLVKNPSGVAG